MIFVKKSKVIPPSLTKKGKNEETKAKADYLKNKSISFEFSAYRQVDVKDELLNIFHGKCAYCESKVDHISPGAVDHFRPKGRNKKTNKAPHKDFIGYYWLAADWDNLLFTCTDCNSERSHAEPGKNERLKMGKQDKFPLTNESDRCISHLGDLKKEETAILLINPCAVDPEKYFTFDCEGMIMPSVGLSDIDELISKKSIETYALIRWELRKARKEYFLETLGDAIMIIESMRVKWQEKGKTIEQISDVLNDLISVQLDSLLDLIKPDKEYSAMIKQLLRSEFQERYNVDIDSYS
jgi:uncharacterized protein (TIGR02646 family)